MVTGLEAGVAPGLERVKKTPQVGAVGTAVARLPRYIQPRPGDITPDTPEA